MMRNESSSEQTMSKPQSVCYLSNDFSQFSFDSGIILCPEGLKNGEQIKAWVADLKNEPKSFATCSLFLIRELELQGNVKVVNLNTDTDLYLLNNTPVSNNQFAGKTSFDEVGDIEILQRELEQADRYMNFNFLKEFDEKFLKEFYDYVFYFYGPGGIYEMNATMDQIKAATETHLSTGVEFEGDTIDRERVRDILIEDFGLKWNNS